MLDKITIENTKYDIIFSPISLKDNKLYKPLVRALWSALTEERKKKLIIINPYNEKHKILNFDKILACYIHTIDITKEYTEIKGKFHTDKLLKYQHFNNKPGCCACGVKIIYEYIIKNIDTNKLYIIGSQCIKWRISEKTIRNTKEIIKSILNNIGCHPSTLICILPKFCPFCKSSRDCIKCKEKQNIKNIFTKWRIYSHMKMKNLITNLKSPVVFGKYKGQIFYKLCQDNSYVNYILNNDFNENIIYKIMNYIKYKHLLNIEYYKKRLVLK